MIYTFTCTLCCTVHCNIIADTPNFPFVGSIHSYLSKLSFSKCPANSNTFNTCPITLQNINIKFSSHYSPIRVTTIIIGLHAPMQRSAVFFYV